MSILNSIFGGGGLLGGIGSMALDVGKMAFPPLAIADGLNNLMGGAIGNAIKGAVDQLCKDAGMPKFIGDLVKGAVDQAVGQQHKHCGNDVTDMLGDAVGKLFDQFSKGAMKDLVNNFQDYKNQACEGKDGTEGGKTGKGGGGKSWFVALMKALGELENQQADKLDKLSKEVSSVLGAGNSSGGSQAAQFDKMEEFKAEAKLQEALAGVAKTVGDAIGNAINSVARPQ
jgi:hypothetical protein